jgi:catechol 2,3-dioxygenase-like lactoylglutathione lyase family enzyme
MGGAREQDAARVPRPPMQQALAFFTDILGFEVRFREANDACLRRETVAFRLLCDISYCAGSARSRMARVSAFPGLAP